MKLIVLFISIFATVLLSLGIDAEKGENWIFNYGQYLIASELLLFAYLLYTTRHALWNMEKRLSRTTLIILGLLMLFTVTREPLQFKVSYDEQVLSATAMNMHFNRKIGYPNAAYEVNGKYELIANNLNKRPALFPLLTSLVHDISGYRINNVFYLNMLLTSLAILLLFLISRAIAGEYPALFVTTLFSLTPLVSQNATGGGFEILNIMLLLLCFWISIQYLRKPSQRLALTLGISALLLAQARYESILYLPFIALILFFGAKKNSLDKLPVSLMAIPLLFIPQLIHLQANINDSETWQVAENQVSTFSTEYLLPNLGAAVDYLFTFSSYNSNNPLLSILGLIAIILFAVRLPGASKKEMIENQATLLATGIFLLAIICHFIVILLYHDGQLNVTETNRYALPILLAFSIAIAVVLKGQLDSNTRKILAVISLVLTAYIFSFPASAKLAPSNAKVDHKRVNWVLSYLNSQPQQDFILLVHYPWDFILHKIPSSTIKTDNNLAGRINFHLQHNTYQNIYVVQDYVIDPVSGKRLIADTDYLGPGFILKEISTMQLSPYQHSSLSVIESIDLETSSPQAEQNNIYSRSNPPEINADTYGEWIDNLLGM